MSNLCVLTYATNDGKAINNKWYSISENNTTSANKQ